MYTWDNEGVETKPIGFNLLGINGCFRIIPVIHDESTFYTNDERKTWWIHESQKATPERKEEGALIMISDFLTSEWGCLTSADGTECVILSFDQIIIPQMCIDREAHIVSKAGKNQNGYFDANNLLAQVDKAINIFEDRTNGFATGLFLFDNAPSHQKHAANALSA